MIQIKAANEAAGLQQQRRFADARIAQLKTELQKRMEELDREQKEELRKHPEQAGLIQGRIAAEKEFARAQLQRQSRLARMDEWQDRQRLIDMKIDFGLRMADRGKPSYTFQGEEEQGGTAVTSLYKEKEKADRQGIEAQTEIRSHVREMRNAMMEIARKMQTINLGAQ